MATVGLLGGVASRGTGAPVLAAALAALRGEPTPLEPVGAVPTTPPVAMLTLIDPHRLALEQRR